jgi:hypothetical protein
VAAALAVSFIAIMVGSYLRKPIPFDAAPELEPLLRSATRVHKDVDTVTNSTGGTSYGAVSLCAARDYEINQSLTAFTAAAREQLREADGWQIYTVEEWGKVTKFIAVKSFIQDDDIVGIRATSAQGFCKLHLTQFTPPLSPFRAWLWRTVGIP